MFEYSNNLKRTRFITHAISYNQEGEIGRKREGRRGKGPNIREACKKLVRVYESKGFARQELGDRRRRMQGSICGGKGGGECREGVWGRRGGAQVDDAFDRFKKMLNLFFAHSVSKHL
jgi:hypothetical protein